MESRGLHLFLIVCVIISVTSVNSRKQLLPIRRQLGLGSPKSNWTGSLPPDQWITQKLDHFNDADTRFWQQRYFVNDTFFKPGGPVFLMIGGEGVASPIWMVTGAWIEYAQKYSALCFQVEHRYYGESHPTKDLSVENLQYLSSEQALADLAFFTTNMTEKYNLKYNKWISFGGSYPGSLSAWYRMKYPHLVHGAVASSAPILAKLNFEEYFEVVSRSLLTTGPGCNEAIQNATDMLNTLIQTQDGRAKISDLFNLCNPIDINNRWDISNLYQTLSGVFADTVQYNRDNKAFEGESNNVTIDDLCNIMTNESLGDPLQRYAAIDRQTENCLDFSYDAMVNELSVIDWGNGAGRQWTYQTCTEFGFYQTADSKYQPFGHEWTLEDSVKLCQDVYGGKFNASFIQRGIDRTNINYGGLGIKVTRILFPNGSIDPWHALSVTNNLGPDAKAVFIRGTAHCANMYPSSPDDITELKLARQFIEENIGLWLLED